MPGKKINELTLLSTPAGGDFIPVYDTSTGGEAKRVSLTDVIGLVPAEASASTSAAGVVELATDAETTALSATNRAVTPGNLLALLNVLYPVGTIYTNSTNNTNPGTLFGFGTWSAFGAGRMMVGYNSSDTDFNTGEKTGGAKTYDLSHTHTGPSHTHTIAHTHTYSGTTSGTAVTYYSNAGDENVPDANNNHTHTYSGTTSASSAADSGASGTGTTGSSGSTTQSVMNPYITVYAWKRTA